jgi:hypothetical protein
MLPSSKLNCDEEGVRSMWQAMTDDRLIHLLHRLLCSHMVAESSDAIYVAFMVRHCSEVELLSFSMVSEVWN